MRQLAAGRCVACLLGVHFKASHRPCCAALHRPAGQSDSSSEDDDGSAGRMQSLTSLECRVQQARRSLDGAWSHGERGQGAGSHDERGQGPGVRVRKARELAGLTCTPCKGVQQCVGMPGICRGNKCLAPFLSELVLPKLTPAKSPAPAPGGPSTGASGLPAGILQEAQQAQQAAQEQSGRDDSLESSAWWGAPQLAEGPASSEVAAGGGSSSSRLNLHRLESTARGSQQPAGAPAGTSPQGLGPLAENIPVELAPTAAAAAGAAAAAEAPPGASEVERCQRMEQALSMQMDLQRQLQEALEVGWGWVGWALGWAGVVWARRAWHQSSGAEAAAAWHRASCRRGRQAPCVHQVRRHLCAHLSYRAACACALQAQRQLQCKLLAHGEFIQRLICGTHEGSGAGTKVGGSRKASKAAGANGQAKGKRSAPSSQAAAGTGAKRARASSQSQRSAAVGPSRLGRPPSAPRLAVALQPCSGLTSAALLPEGAEAAYSGQVLVPQDAMPTALQEPQPPAQQQQWGPYHPAQEQQPLQALQEQQQQAFFFLEQQAPAAGDDWLAADPSAFQADSVSVLARLAHNMPVREQELAALLSPASHRSQQQVRMPGCTHVLRRAARGLARGACGAGVAGMRSMCIRLAPIPPCASSASCLALLVRITCYRSPSAL